ncbi:MAG: hypothetical protein GQ574_02255 [Crocinitomix sp.]|nr:hypothetical protein [Crocinitomix sp.]
MDNEREGYLEICQTCTKSKFDRQKGLVCTLTNAKANFDLNKSCPDYQKDEKFTRIQAAAKKRVSASQSDESTAAFWRPVSLIFIIIGILFCIVGLIGFLGSIRFGIAPFPFFLGIGGLFMFSKGLVEFNKLSRHRNITIIEKKDDFDEFDDLDEII